mmetsp:Transcript_20486/g.40881  ORF Transcript_20486/g.40881 Transcript_20486/m.40881 type:complete len:498 (-) Transcript_20486:80-1573(-)
MHRREEQKTKEDTSTSTTMSDTPLATTQLFKAINACKWQTVGQQIQSDPSLAKIESDGLLPLHAVCNAPLRAPLKLIKMLLTAHPAAAQLKCGKEDRLPIHILLATTATPYIPYTPPSEDVVSALIELYPGAARVPDGSNQLPIHLACNITGVSEKVLTFILSTYPEGAYVRDFHGKYPLDYATTNKDIPTRKLALAALDRGTLYASISKMTSLRLSKENESKTRSMEEVYEKKLNKMESHAKEERAKLVAQLDSMTKQLKEEKESNQALCEEKEKMVIEKDQAVARAIQFERARYAKLEEQLRSDLADVQLKNMDLLEQLESTQGDLDASNQTEEKHIGEIDALKQQLSETNNKLDGTKDEFYMTQEELETVQVELVAATNVIKQKSARITHLEQSLDSTKSSVLHLIQEHERAQANMEKQKEYLGIFINQQINAEKEAKTSLLKMSLLVDAIDVSQRVEGNLKKVVAEEGAMIDASTMTVKEVLEEKSELAEESQ